MRISAYVHIWSNCCLFVLVLREGLTSGVICCLLVQQKQKFTDRYLNRAEKTLYNSIKSHQSEFHQNVELCLHPAFVTKQLFMAWTEKAGPGEWDRVSPVLRSAHWLPVCQIIDFKTTLLVYKAQNGQTVFLICCSALSLYMVWSKCHNTKCRGNKSIPSLTRLTVIGVNDG